jgi:hypothetical protein
MVSVFGRRLSMKKSDVGTVKEKDTPTPSAAPVSAGTGGGILSGFRETVRCTFSLAIVCANAICL